MEFERLRRWPAEEGEGLRAWDAADALVLDEAAEALAATPREAIVVIDDDFGALTLGALDAAPPPSGREAAVRVHSDALTGERAIARNAERAGLADAVRLMPFDATLVEGARLVLLRLPRSLDRLDEVAALVAAHADPGVVLVAGGRLKHMTTAMNEVLWRRFARLDVSLARQKSRVLIAREPIREPIQEPMRASAPAAGAHWPQRRLDRETGLEVVAHGGVFAGAGIDIGTRFLLEHLDGAVERLRAAGDGAGDAASARAVDLACGSGVVAARLARLGVRVVASDRSAAAVASAREAGEANGVGALVEVHRADGLEHLPDASERLVVLNPPFHAGAALTERIAERLFADAARVLEPGGELWCVWNSHLRYRGRLASIVGPTRQIARNPKFTITASSRA